MGIVTREHQYSACFDERPVTLGPMTGATYRWNPRRLGMMLARYKFVAKMLYGAGDVAEIGCSDGFAAPIVGQEVHRLMLYDFDPAFVTAARQVWMVECHDICSDPLPKHYDAIYMLDVLEHINPEQEDAALRNIVSSLRTHGVFIAGIPSLESQTYASEISKAGHVNCKTGPQLKAFAEKFFHNVFLFGMNDEVLHTGFSPMCHYLFVICAGPRLTTL